MLNLPLLSVGAVGFVSVVGHVVTPELRAMVDAHVAGDVQKALEIHQKLLHVFTGMFRTQGLLVPVWDLAPGTGAEALEDPAAALSQRLEGALASSSELTGAERSARSGLAHRQVTIR